MNRNETLHFSPNSNSVNFLIGDRVIIGPNSETPEYEKFEDIVGLTEDGSDSADRVAGRIGTVVEFSTLFPKWSNPCPSAKVLIDGEVFVISLHCLGRLEGRLQSTVS